MKTLVAIGGSAGGVAAVSKVLAGLGAGFPLPVAIVLHRHTEGSDQLEKHLAKTTSLKVCAAEDKMPIEAGTVTIAPADYHLLIDDGRYSLSTEERVQYARPSIDVLFESAARAMGSGVVAVVLTGANADGARGAACAKAAGGLVLVEDPATAEVATMPLAALAATAVDRVLPVTAIAAALVEIASGRA